VVTSPPYTKTKSKIEKTNFRRQAIQEPIFSVANVGFEGGCDGRGCVCGTFLVICAQPSHMVMVYGYGSSVLTYVPFPCINKKHIGFCPAGKMISAGQRKLLVKIGTA
jgi:hypothetical protein